MSAGPSRRPVWSSEPEPECVTCGKPRSECACHANRKKDPPRGEGTVRVGRSTKGRRGKGVTVVTGLPLGPSALQALAKELKRLCGSGGTSKDGVIEIQGEHRDRLVEALRERGFSAKRAGG